MALGIYLWSVACDGIGKEHSCEAYVPHPFMSKPRFDDLNMDGRHSTVVSAMNAHTHKRIKAWISFTLVNCLSFKFILHRD